MARGKYKGPKRGASQRHKAGPEEDDEDERRGVAAQNARAGNSNVPDSDDEDAGPKFAKGAPLNIFGAIGAPGDLPPNSSDEDSDDDSEIVPHGAPEPVAELRRRPKNEDEPDPEQIAKDMKRLAMIRDKREQERLDRIKKEGWDRFAPITDTNKPPAGKGPPPSAQKDDDDDEDDDDDDEDDSDEEDD